MISFMKIATFAALAFGTFTCATPVVEQTSTDVNTSCTTCERSSGSSVALSAVLEDLKDSLTEACNPLYSLDPNMVTVDIVGGIAANIQSAFDAALHKCNSGDVYFEGAFTIGPVIYAIAEIVSLCVSACIAAKNACGYIEGLLDALYSAVDACLASLIKACISIIGGIVASLFADITAALTAFGCTDILYSLDFYQTLSACGL